MTAKCYQIQTFQRKNARKAIEIRICYLYVFILITTNVLITFFFVFKHLKSHSKFTKIV